MSVELAGPTFPVADDVAIARQPIHDRMQRVVGYELLFQGHPGHPDEERAIASLVVETFAGVGVGAVAGRRPAHVRVSRKFLLELHGFALPRERAVLELPAPDPADGALIAVLRRLAGEGYAIVLVCDPHAPIPPAPVLRLAAALKLDVSSMSPNELTAAAARYRPATDVLIAAGVDDPALYARCRELGFHRFQGFFFCTPDLVHARVPAVTRLGELRAVAGLYGRRSLTFEEFERIIAQDVGLSYRLLQYLNSAFFNLPRPVSSVREALMMLGMRAVRRWATLVALSGAEDKPNELTVTALLRARLCELIGRHRPAPTAGTDAFFTVGLFSVIDAMMDAPMDDVLRALPLGPDTRAALVEHRGEMGDAIAATLAWERGDLEEVERRLPGLALGELYLEAVHFADQACGALDDGQSPDSEGDVGDDAATGAQSSDGEVGPAADDGTPPTSTGT